MNSASKPRCFHIIQLINNINIITSNIEYIDTITKAKKDYSGLDLPTISSEIMTKHVQYC